MGIFANEEPGVGTILTGPPQRRLAWHGQSGFDAMGHEVPPFRKTAAERHLKDMGFKDHEIVYSVVSVMSEYIRRGDTHAAMEQAYKIGVDVTGVYRIMAVLLAEEEPEPNYD